MPVSAANKPKAYEKKIQIKEKKLNFALIQNGKISVIFFCLQAKVQLFQEYRELFEIFFWQSFEKAWFFQVERLLKNFYNAAKQEKSLYSCKENRKLNTVASMVAKIDIDAL